MIRNIFWEIVFFIGRGEVKMAPIPLPYRDWTCFDLTTTYKKQDFSKNIYNHRNSWKLYTTFGYKKLGFQGIWIVLPQLGGDACTLLLSNDKPEYTYPSKIISKPRNFRDFRATSEICRIVVRPSMVAYSALNQSTRSNSFISGWYDDPGCRYDHLRVPWS